jgi:TonB family protein
VFVGQERAHQPASKAYLHLVRASALAVGLCVAAVASAQTTPGITAPVVVHETKAVYPLGALARKSTGSVVVLATVTKDGAVKSAEVSESSGDAELDRAAVDAALSWRFTPAMQGDAPIESEMRIPFHFHLAAPPPATPMTAPPAAPPPSEPPAAYTSNVSGRREPLSRGTTDYHIDVGALSAVPHANASDFLKLAPGILLTNEGGEAHAEQVFMRGFDAREGQDIEFSVDGTPFNESGNLHGNGYADTHFIIPELVSRIRVIEGPYDPRQGNYAVAGSVDYELGLAQPGITTSYTYGSFNTNRLLFLWGPKSGDGHTFVGVDLYQTDGFGQNRQARHATVMAQYEGTAGRLRYRIAATGYIASAGSAGLIREDDYKAGRIGFYGTYDPNQGEDVSRYSVTVDLEQRYEHIVVRNLIYGIIRPYNVRENFTGFINDVQQPQQDLHLQRGDLIDLSNMAYTVGARGSGRMTGHLFKQPQELEVGYFLRGDFGTSLQQRIEAATNVPYHTDTNLDWKLGDIGLYADANLRATSWLAVRGGLRADFFTYDVNNLCAVQTTPDYPAAMSPQDASCLSQQNFGAYREPNQRSTSVGIAYQPRASLVLGPWKSLGATVSYGKGARSIDPVYITGDNHQEPFASTQSVDAGVSYARQLRYFLLSATGTFFRTGVSQDLIFSQTAGRNILGGASTRLGTAETFRLTGSFYDLAANFTYVDAYFDGPDPTQPNSPAHPLVPYIPDIVFRFDGAIHGEIPIKKLRLWRRPFFGSLATGITYVAPRPLPQDQRGDAIFTIDLNARIGWWIFELGVSATNLLDSKYKLNSYNYVSDFHTQGTYQPLVPSQMFAAGPPLTVLGTLTVHIGASR